MINYLEKGLYNFLLNMFFYFIIPIMLINYYIFFKNDNYKLVIKNYKKEYNKKFFAIYFALGFLLMFGSLFLKNWLPAHGRFPSRGY